MESILSAGDIPVKFERPNCVAGVDSHSDFFRQERPLSPKFGGIPSASWARIVLGPHFSRPTIQKVGRIREVLRQILCSGVLGLASHAQAVETGMPIQCRFVFPFFSRRIFLVSYDMNFMCRSCKMSFNTSMRYARGHLGDWINSAQSGRLIS